MSSEGGPIARALCIDVPEYANAGAIAKRIENMPAVPTDAIARMYAKAPDSCGESSGNIAIIAPMIKTPTPIQMNDTSGFTWIWSDATFDAGFTMPMIT